MAKVNRYTNIQPAQYNPMSLQELMLVPQYKRTQHDNLLEAGSAINEGLLQVNPLDIHSDAARKEQEKISNSIQSQVDLLSKEGFNPNSKQAFFDLNKQYNQAIAPTGTLGRINNAKQILEANKKAHIDAAIKEGFTGDAALRNWQQHEQKYIQEYQETGKINPISELGAPKYVDYLDTATNLFKDAGFTELDLAGGVISRLVTTDPKGQYVLNEGGGKITKNNIGQLTKAVEWLNNNITNPNSQIGQSIQYEGKSPLQVLNEIGNLAEVYVNSSQKNDYTRTMTNFTPTIKDDTSRPPNFIKDIIQGIDIKNIDATSPLNMTETFKNVQYDNKGNIIANKGDYKTYQEKIKAIQDKGTYGNVTFDPNTGLYKGTLKAMGSPGPGASMSGVIPKDPYHYKSDLDKMRIDNPELKGISDKELIERLSNYRESLGTNYVASIEIPGANYEWMNDRLFGNQSGTGEKATGMFSSKGATIKGQEYTATEVIDQLGYDNIKNFKESGQPTIRGYVPTLGKWRATVANSEGEDVDIFLDDISEFSDKTRLTQSMAKMSFEGKAFAPIGKTSDGQTMYFVNDFIEPRIVKSFTGITTASQIPPNHMREAKSFEEVNARETMGLVNDQLFQQLSNTKQK